MEVADSASSILSHLHWACLQLVSKASGRWLQGLSSITRFLDLSPKMKKQLRLLDSVSGWVRHCSHQRSRAFLLELEMELSRCCAVQSHLQSRLHSATRSHGASVGCTRAPPGLPSVFEYCSEQAWDLISHLWQKRNFHPMTVHAAWTIVDVSISRFVHRHMRKAEVRADQQKIESLQCPPVPALLACLKWTICQVSFRPCRHGSKSAQITCQPPQKPHLQIQTVHLCMRQAW